MRLFGKTNDFNHRFFTNSLSSCTKKLDEPEDEIVEETEVAVENEAYADYETSKQSSKRESSRAEADDYQFSTDF